MDFRILGRTQVVAGDAEIALGGSQRRSLLAVLLVDAGVVVPAERLVDALWPVHPPMSAGQTVQSHVSHLRKLLGADRIETVAGGYRLVVDEAEVDAIQFEREFERGRLLAGSGDPAAATSVLDTALGRWRGHAFEDAEGSERAVAESARLEGLRTSALELLLDARLALGQHDRVAADAEAAVLRWPLRERLWASLITALYRCGRHADALSAYQRLRVTLAEELGLEPSPSLVDLEARILRHDASLLLSSANGAAALPPARSAGREATTTVEPPPQVGNLPTRSTSFIGRERETKRVVECLAAASLVTVTGVGGVGKTRLALHVAGELASALEDGAWLCELAAVDRPEAVAQVVAATLGVPSGASVDLTEGLVDFLRGKRLLLVLDNCEHLLTGAGDLAEALLEACPDLQILATSREGLAVDGEQVVPLRSLELPPPRADDAAVAASAAVRLFVERASAAGAELALEGDDLLAVGEICRRLDGVPLALELAAARAAAMSPPDIAVHLDERFRLLTGGRRNAVERHQTLRAAVDWSYASLSPRDRAVFDRLGVFAGPFDLTAAVGVVAGDGILDFDAVDALTSLVAKSMVVADRPSGGMVRYRLLETMRQYARDRLDESGVADARRRRHAAYFAELAEQAGPGLQGSDEVVWRRRIAEDLDNLRAAVTWSLDREDHADVELGVRVVVALVLEGVVRRASGISSWSRQALEREELLSPAQLHDVRSGAAWDLFQSGDMPSALALARQAVADGVPDGASYTAGGYMALATTSGMLGDLDGARRAFAEGRAAVRGAADEDYCQAALLSAEAMTLAGVGAIDDARVEAEEALQLARKVRNPTVLVMANFALGCALTTDPVASRAALEECIALSNAGAVESTLGGALARVAPLRLRDGDQVGAIDALLGGLARLREIGDLPSLVSLVDAAASILHGLGETEAAVLASLLFERAGVPIGLHAETAPGQRDAILARLRAEEPHLVEGIARRCDQLSTEEMLDSLVEELARRRASLAAAPT